MFRHCLQCLLVLGLLLSVSASASNPGEVESPLTLPLASGVTTENYLRYDIDEGRTAEFPEQLERARAGNFTFSEETSPHFGYTDAAIWLYLPLQAPADESGRWMVEIQHPLLSDITVEVHHEDGQVEQFTAGQRVPFDQWPVEHRNVTIPVDMTEGEIAELLIRVSSTSSMQLPLMVWPESTFTESAQRSNLWFGLFYGVILALLLYNLLLYFGLRDVNYLYYVSYVGLYMLSQLILNGLAFQLLWPNATAWAEMSTAVVIALAFIAAAMFSRSFLQLPSRLPIANYVVYGLIAGFSLAVLWGVLISPRGGLQVAATMSIVNTFALVAIATISLRTGFTQARYFLLAWTVFLIGTAVYGLRAVGLLPNVFVTEFGVQIGAVIQMLMLSFALAHRMRIVEEEKQQVEREAKTTLEERVKERTAELDSALSELSESNQTLEQRTRLFETLVEINQLAPGIRDPETLLSRLLPRVAQALPGTGLAVIARAPGTPSAIIHVHFHEIESPVQKRILSLLRGKKIDSELPVKLPSLGNDRQGLLLTMHNRLRQLEGLFILVRTGSGFGAAEREAAALFADNLSASLEAVLLQRRLEAKAEVDESTGLYKRSHLDKILHREIRNRKAHEVLSYGVIFLRIRDLDALNTRYGFQAGEQLVRETGELLRKCCRSGDELGLWRPGQLAIICPGIRKSELSQLVDQIGHSVDGQSITLESADGSGFKHQLRLEIGAASSEEAESADGVVDLADAQLRGEE